MFERFARQVELGPRREGPMFPPPNRAISTELRHMCPIPFIRIPNDLDDTNRRNTLNRQLQATCIQST